MPTSSEFQRLYGRAGIHRFAGLPPQFEKAERGWLFRRHGHGPAIHVTDDEYAAFMRAGLNAVVVHVLALAVFAWLAWLLLKRTLPNWGDNAIALVFGVVLSLIALALYTSIRQYADAPARALAHRKPERPARDLDGSMQPAYSTVVALTLVLLFMAAIGTRQPTSSYVAFASASVVLGLILAVRRMRFERMLTDDQRHRLRQREVAEQAAELARQPASEPLWKGVLLLVFVALELVIIGIGVLLGLGIALAISGRTFDEMGFGLFMLGFFPGLAIGGLLFWPLERLCKRWTGSSAVDAFDWIPAGW